VNTVALREVLSQKFLVTTPEAFWKDIEQHRRRIAACSAPLAPGERETWLDFRFYPALEPDRLQRLRDFSAWVEERVARPGAITCLPLFLNLVQLQIFMTLLLGEQDRTGLALASYAAVMQGALDYYSCGGLSEQQLGALQEHREMSQYIGETLLGCGKSHEFASIFEAAVVAFRTAFDQTLASVRTFFDIASARVQPTTAHSQGEREG
jgi:hypothetical protein